MFYPVVMQDPFDGLVGQSQVKNQLGFYLEAFKKNPHLPHLFLCGATGLGKTNFARKFAKALGRKIIEINCASFKKVSTFIDDIFVPHVQGREVCLFFDEAHALSQELTNAFLTILNSENGSEVEYLAGNGITYYFDFNKINVIFATTESDQMFRPLAKRLTKIDFADYHNNDLATILANSCQGVEFEPEALELLAGTSRGEPRSCVLRADEIKRYAETKGAAKIGMDEAKHLLQILNIHPMGLGKIEWTILELLDQINNCSLSYIASATGLSPSSIKNDHERFLIKNKLMVIDGQRRISRQGRVLVRNFWQKQNQEQIHV